MGVSGERHRASGEPILQSAGGRRAPRLPPGAEPDANLTEDNFFNLSIATTQWNIQIDLTTPAVNTRLDLSKIRDIELRMDTTYVTPSQTRQLVELDKQRVALETAGRPVPEELRRAIVEQEASYRQMLRAANAGQVKPASAAAVASSSSDALAISMPARSQTIV